MAGLKDEQLEATPAKAVKIWFADFWPGFDMDNDFLRATIPSDISVTLDPINPDILFYSCFGRSYLEYDCIRVFYTGENVRPDFNLCDYAIGFDYLEFGDRHFRFPLFLGYKYSLDEIMKRREPISIDEVEKREFCNFVYSNNAADPRRDAFFHHLNAVRPVHSLGRHLRNDERLQSAEPDDPTHVKVQITRDFNFSTAFENSSTLGYTTEKILEAFAARTIPIYWGNPKVELEFNPRAFVNRHSFESDQSCIDYIMELASDTPRMLEMLNAPVFVEGYDPYAEIEKLRSYIGMIFKQSAPDMRRRARYGRTLSYERDIKKI